MYDCLSLPILCRHASNVCQIMALLSFPLSHILIVLGDTMLRVYPASKIPLGWFWLDLHDRWKEIYIHARWIKHWANKTQETPANAREFWVEDFEDIENADLVVVYAQENDQLRGALVEVGYALCLGLPVVLIGNHKDFGTWQHHPDIIKVANLIEFRKYLKTFQAAKRDQNAGN